MFPAWNTVAKTVSNGNVSGFIILFQENWPKKWRAMLDLIWLACHPAWNNKLVLSG